MNNFCRMCGEQIGGGILYCLVCAPKAAAHIEIESLQADNAALRQRVKELEKENERLRGALKKIAIGKEFFDTDYVELRYDELKDIANAALADKGGKP